MTTSDDVRAALAIVRRRENLRRTTTIAAVVGIVLFTINQLDVVVAGDATPTTWIKAAVTFVVPFLVSNLGILHATNHRVDDVREPNEPVKASDPVEPAELDQTA